MANDEQREDRVSLFLAGKLSAEEQARFRADLESDPVLQKEFDELRYIRVGLDAADTMAGEHLDTRTLAAYAVDPDQLGDETRRDVARHLDTCADCREELRSCRDTVPVARSESRFLDFINWLFAPRLIMRPALVLGLLTLLVTPLTYLALRSHVSSEVLAVSVVPTGTRAPDEAIREISITPDAAVIRLESNLPGLDNEYCSFSLYFDAEQTPQMIRNDYLRGNSFVLDIPTSYLHRDGKYTLLVHEPKERGGEESIPFKYQFKITHTN